MVKSAEIMRCSACTRTTRISLKNSKGLLWEIDGKKPDVFHDPYPITAELALSLRVKNLHRLRMFREADIFYGDW